MKAKQKTDNPLLMLGSDEVIKLLEAKVIDGSDLNGLAISDLGLTVHDLLAMLAAGTLDQEDVRSLIGLK